MDCFILTQGRLAWPAAFAVRPALVARCSRRFGRTRDAAMKKFHGMAIAFALACVPTLALAQQYPYEDEGSSDSVDSEAQAYDDEGYADDRYQDDRYAQDDR